MTTALDRWLSRAGLGRHVRIERPERRYMATAYEQAPMLRPITWAHGATQVEALEALSARLEQRREVA